jgi:hypothetical protein
MAQRRGRRASPVRKTGKLLQWSCTTRRSSGTCHSTRAVTDDARHSGSPRGLVRWWHGNGVGGTVGPATCGSSRTSSWTCSRGRKVVGEDGRRRPQKGRTGEVAARLTGRACGRGGDTTAVANGASAQQARCTTVGQARRHTLGTAWSGRGLLLGRLSERGEW